MNNAKIWTVVKPSTGIPLMLGAVAVTSLIVHAGIVTQSNWAANFFNGVPMNAVVAVAPAQ